MWILSFVLAFSPVASAAEADVVLADDAAAIHRLIDDQIGAFRRHDAQGAWRHVSPELQLKFGSAERFLEMVRVGYRPVYAPRSYTFGPMVALPDGTGQWLELVGPDGERVRALYLLERQPDGTWRTSGCLLYADGEDKPSV